MKSGDVRRTSPAVSRESQSNSSGRGSPSNWISRAPPAKKGTGPVALGDGPAWFVLWESRARSGFDRLGRLQNEANQLPLTSVRALAPLDCSWPLRPSSLSLESVPATAATE